MLSPLKPEIGMGVKLSTPISLANLEADPHPILAELREFAPAVYVQSIDMWLITRWDDVVHVCQSPELFTAKTDPARRSAPGVSL